MKVTKRIAFIVSIMLAIPLAINALSYSNFDFSYGFLQLKTRAIETGWYLPAYYAHVLVAAFILLIGIFQIHPASRATWPALHRAFGKIYVGGILFFSAPGGLIMSLFINRGPLVLASFLLQCTAWFIFTYLAYHYIHKGNVQAHQQWMLRSYALTLAAITLRIYVFISSWSFDLAQPAAYATIAWLSWVPNLLVCELFFQEKDKRFNLS
jgi:uncharacterized membrane protein YozB (DUF420 family)